jgi:hypothetical protein
VYPRYGAAICRRGHVQTSAFELADGNPLPHCKQCGARILVACQSCGYSIPGRFRGGAIGGRYTKPVFCEQCGAPFSWVDRQGRLWQLENLLDDQDLPDNDRLVVREQLAALQEGADLDEQDQGRRWGRIKALAPGLIDTGRTIVITVTSAAIQKQLGI